MPDQQGVETKGGTMRLGKYPCVITPGTKMADCYGTTEIDERHRHRYEFNNEFRAEFEEKGLVIAGTSPDGRLVEAVEIARPRFPSGRAVPPRVQEPPEPCAPPVQGLHRRRAEVPERAHPDRPSRGAGGVKYSISRGARPLVTGSFLRPLPLRHLFVYNSFTSVTHYSRAAIRISIQKAAGTKISTISCRKRSCELCGLSLVLCAACGV